MSSYIRLFGFDIVAGEHACAVAYRAAPPLSVSLAHQDHVPFFERQITTLRRLIGIQRQIFWRGRQRMSKR